MAVLSSNWLGGQLGTGFPLGNFSVAHVNSQVSSLGQDRQLVFCLFVFLFSWIVVLLPKQK